LSTPLLLIRTIQALMYNSTRLMTSFELHF